MNMTMVKVGIAIVALGGAFALGYNSAPKKADTVETVKENRDVSINTREVIKPDGTIVRTSKTKDKTKIDSKSETTISKPNWKVSGLVGIDSDKRTIYGASVDRRILGNVFVGVWANTAKMGGLSVGMEF